MEISLVSKSRWRTYSRFLSFPFCILLSDHIYFVVGQQNVIISHLQYADETLCVGEATVEKSLDFEGYSSRFWDGFRS
jgi:hypothetical protein